MKQVTVLDANDKFFVRGPQIGHFKRIDENDSHLSEFTFMQGHIKPDSTLTALEIDAFANLTEVVLNHGKFLETDFEVLFPNDPFPSDILVAGDFNADGSYLSNTKQSNLIYTTNPAYFWVVEDDTDTTVAQSDNTEILRIFSLNFFKKPPKFGFFEIFCIYDRIIIRGDNIMASVCDEVKVEAFDKNLVPGADWGTFRFDDMFNAINTAANETYEVKHVSDHYPVFVTLY